LNIYLDQEFWKIFLEVCPDILKHPNVRQNGIIAKKKRQYSRLFLSRSLESLRLY